MKAMLCFAVVIVVTVFASAQTASCAAARRCRSSAQTASAPKSNWLADSVIRNGDVMQMDGHVKIAACSVITADHAVGGPNANDTELTGNVHLTLTNGVDSLSER